MGVAEAFDVLLAVMVLVLAWSTLAARDLFTSVVLYIAFGLTLALVWVRLQAVDVALAEVAIGAGLTGALLLSALGDLQSPPAAPRDDGGAAQGPDADADERG